MNRKILLVVVSITSLLFASTTAGQSSHGLPPFSGVQGAFFAVSVGDLDASTHWYVEKFGLRIDKRDASAEAKVAILSGNGLLVELIERRDSKPLGKPSYEAQGIFKAGLVVENIDTVFETLKARNVEIAFGMFPAKPDAPYKNFAVRDNAGNLIQFFGK